MIAADAPVEVFDEIDSTMLEARRRAERGDLGPVWLMAKRQSAGRGRRGRSWVSAEGNLYVTYLAPTDRAPADLALLSFAAGIALCESLDEDIGAGRARLKWPNDVLIDGAKISGLMLDSGKAARGGWAALGIGVNLGSAPEGLDQPTTSLQAQLRGEKIPSARAFLERLQPRLAHWDGVFVAEGFGPLRRAWMQRAQGLGQEARIAQGETSVSGRIVGLSPRGELELDTELGPRLIAAGDVFFPNAAQKSI